MLRKTNRHVIKITLLAALSAAAANNAAHAQKNPPSLGGFFNGLKDAISTIGGAASAPTANSVTNATTTALSAKDSLKNAGVNSKLITLYAKGTVTGEDLYSIIKTIQTEARQRKTMKAWAQFAVSADQTLNQISTGQSFDPTELLKDTATKAALELLKTQLLDVGMKALDGHLNILLEDKAALAAESIELPSFAISSEAQAKRTINLASMIVAARLTSKILEKADSDFKSLETDYKTLIEQRESAATLLFTALDEQRKSGASANLENSFSQADVTFLEKNLSQLKVSEFAKDIGAQNLALRLLSQKDPSAFKSYKIQADSFVVRSRAYLRSVSGVVAFGALMANFAQTVNDLAKDKNKGNLLMSMPLGTEFLKAAGPLAPKVIQVSADGLVLQPGKSLLSTLNIFGSSAKFTVTLDDKQETTDAKSSKDVFTKIEQAQAIDLFKEALFRSDSKGLLAGIRDCDPVEAGRMIDKAAPADTRSLFAKNYFTAPSPVEPDSFTFVSAFESRGAANDKMMDLLINQDHRKRSSITSQNQASALGSVQHAVANGYFNWNDDQLTRLILANRDGQAAAHANLQIGNVNVRPIASMQAIYIYESHADSCRKSTLSASAQP